MKITRWAGALALALLSCAPVAAQHATTSVAPAGFAPEMAVVTIPALSVPLTGTATSTAATPTSGSATIATGVASIGPFTPQLGLPIRLILKGGATFTGYAATTTGTDCSVVNQLTAGGAPISYSGSVDEYVDVPPTTGSVKYCLVLTVTSGTETYGVRQ